MTASRQTTPPGESVKTFVSLSLFIHLFCVAVVLGSSFSPSLLQQRLVSLFSPYTKTLHLDPNYVPPNRRLPATPSSAFHLTTGEENTRLHQWLLTTADGTTYRFPGQHWRGSFLRQRLDMLGQVAAFHARLDIDEVPAEIVRSLARNFFTRVEQDAANQPIYVRCVQHVGESDPLTFDPSDNDAGVNILYEADVWLDASNNGPPTVNVLKRTPISQSAPPVDVGNLR